MAKSSINIKPSSSNAIIHNERIFDVAYAIDSESQNEYKMIGNIKTVERDIYADYLEHHGRRLNSKATPIREAVINLNENHIMADVEKLCVTLQQEFKIQPLHIAIHRDEGHKNDEGENIYNYHAHVIFSNYDFQTHRSIKLDKFDMSKMQTITADTLNMERGKIGSTSVRLEHREYKRAMQEVSKAIKLEHSSIGEELKPINDLNDKYFKAKTPHEFAEQVEKKLTELANLYKQTREQMKETKQAKQPDYSALKIEYQQLEKELKKGVDSLSENVFRSGFKAYKNLLERNNTSITQKLALKTLKLPNIPLLHITESASAVFTKIEAMMSIKHKIEEVPIQREIIKTVEKIVEVEKTVDVIVERKIENKVIHDIDVNKAQALKIKALQDENALITNENQILKTSILGLKHDYRCLANQNLRVEEECIQLRNENNMLKNAIQAFLSHETIKDITDATKSLIERLNDICEPIYNLFRREKADTVEKTESSYIEVEELEQPRRMRR